MRKEVQLLIARQFWVSTFKSKVIFFLMGIMVVLLIYAVNSGSKYHDQNPFRTDHQEKACESWESNPDKRPHRMVHFGTFAFEVFVRHDQSSHPCGVPCVALNYSIQINNKSFLFRRKKPINC